MVDENYKYIVDDIDNHNSDLEKQIIHINLRQTEIMNLITILQQAINDLELLIKKEKDGQIKAKMYGGISKNMELLTGLYGTYNAFESVKNKYYQDIGRNKKDKHRMIEIEIRNLDLKHNTLQASSNDAIDFIRKFTDLLSKTNTDNLSPSIISDLDHPDYLLD